MKKSVVLAVIVAFATLLICGCSSGSGSGGSNNADGNTGSFTVGISWPDGSSRQSENSKVIPAGSDTCEITLEGEKISPAIVSSVSFPSTELTIDNIPIGNTVATIKALNSSSNTLAQRKESFEIKSGETVTSDHVPLGIAITGTSGNPVFQPSELAMTAPGSKIYIQNWMENSVDFEGSLGEVSLDGATNSDGLWTFPETTGNSTSALSFNFPGKPVSFRTSIRGAYTATTLTDGKGPNGYTDEPKDIAVDSNSNVYVVDYSKSEIMKYDSAGTYITTLGTHYSLGGLFQSPVSIDVDSSGNLYVADNGYSRIYKLDSAGGLITCWGSYGTGNYQFKSPSGVAVGNDGSVYVADAGNYRIMKYDSSFTYVRQWGSNGTGIYGFTSMGDIDVSNTSPSYVYATDWTRMMKYNTDGEYQTQWSATYIYGISACSNGYLYYMDGNQLKCTNSTGSASFSVGTTGVADNQFYWAISCGANPSGSLVYVGDDGNKQLYKYNSSGTYQLTFGKWRNNNGTLASAMDIESDSSGNIYVTQTLSHRMSKFNSAGQFVKTIGAAGYMNNNWYYPYGSCIDRTNSYIYICCCNYASIHKIDLNGNFQWSTYNNSGLSAPRDVCINSDNSVLYIVDSTNCRVSKCNTSNGGSLTHLFGTSGSGNTNLSSPMSIAYRKIGNNEYLLIADSGNGRIQRWLSTSGGTWGYDATVVSNGSEYGKASLPYKIYVDSSGNIYDVESSSRIQKFDWNGNLLSVYDNYGKNDPQAQDLLGITTDISGNILVTDYFNHKILKIQ